MNETYLEGALAETEARGPGALNLWGWVRVERFVWIALVITAAFVWFEARYNIDLLNTLSDPNASSKAVDQLSQRGKLLASLGITWAVARSLIIKIKPAVAGLAAFCGVATGVYFALDITYTRVIAGLDREVKVEGFNLFNYRRDLLTERLFDPDIPLPAKDPVAGRILMGAFPIVILDERFMLPARDIVERKANDKSRTVLAKAEQNWPRYQRQMYELDNSYREFINQSRRAFNYRAFGGIQRFRRESQGLEPGPYLSRDGFINMLRNADHPRGEALRAAEKREIGKRPDGTILRAGEVPYFMSWGWYINWFRTQASEAKAAALPTAETIETFRGIDDINAAVFLPPMAIITSLTSALTNLITLVLMLVSIGLVSAGRHFEKIGQLVMRYAAPLMLVIFFGAIVAMPSHIFEQGTPMHELESSMHEQVGLAGKVWSRLSNVQALLLTRGNAHEANCEVECFGSCNSIFAY